MSNVEIDTASTNNQNVLLLNALERVVKHLGRFWWQRVIDEQVGKFGNEPFYQEQFDAATVKEIWYAAIREVHRHLGIEVDLVQMGYDVKNAPTGEMEIAYLKKRMN